MIVLGVSGATCSGKTTICNILKRIFINTRVFNQDDYYWPEDSSKHIRDENSIINWEIMSGFDMDTMHSDIKTEIASYSEDSKNQVPSIKWRVEDVFSSTDSLQLKIDPDQFDHIKLVLVEGILVLNDTRISDLCDARFFLYLDKDTCWNRRQTRTYDPEDQEGYFERYAWPYYVSNLEQFKLTNRSVTYLNGSDSIQQNLCNILNSLADNAT